MRKETFVDLYIKGKKTIDDMEEFISTYSVMEEDTPYEILGLTEEEYKLLIHNKKLELEDVLKAKKFRHEILSNAKIFFRDEIASSHKSNTLKLTKLKSFNLNPFLDKYKANFLAGDDSPESIAKALIYPRVLGTSINTTFGNKMQKFCSDVLGSFASTTTGIDIEFIDMIDGNRKYCQIKSGPNTINKDDVSTIDGHFQAIKNLARTNNLSIGFNDLIVGVLYGEKEELSGHYKNIEKNYPVYIGQEFWYRLTGDEDFYVDLSNAMAEVAKEYDSKELLDNVINELAIEITKKYKSNDV